MGFKTRDKYGRSIQPETNLLYKRSGIGNKMSYYYGGVTNKEVRKYDGIMEAQPFDAQDLHKGTMKPTERPSRLGTRNTISPELARHYKKLGDYYNKKG